PRRARRPGRPLAAQCAVRAQRRARQQHAARGAGQSGLRGGGRLLARARIQSRLRRPAAGRAPVRARRAGDAGRATGRSRAAAAPRAARTRCRATLGRVLGRRGAGGSGMSQVQILHLQKVAGISGSEGHLLSLLPRLRERGWEVRMLMLHENEPGAWDFAAALRARGVPLDAIPLRADFDPIAFVRLAAYLARMRPMILHTHLVHADAYGLLAGTAAGVPLRVSTKHGFNEFREAPYFGLADRAFASLAHVHIAISRGLARYLEDVEGFDDESFEIVHYGIDPDGEPEPYRDSVRPLRDAIVRVAGDLELARQMGAAGRRRALSRFLQVFCTERTELLYEGALDRER